MSRFNPLKPAPSLQVKVPVPSVPAPDRPAPVPVPTAKPDPSGPPTLTENLRLNGLELRFPEKPDQAVLDALNDHPRWNWSGRQKLWYARNTPENRAFAEQFLPQATVPVVPAPIAAAHVAPAPVAIAAPVEPPATNIVPVAFHPPAGFVPVIAKPLPAWKARLLRQ